MDLEQITPPKDLAITPQTTPKANAWSLFPPLSDMNTPRIAEPRSPFDVHDMLVPSTIGTADITHQRTRSDENVAVAKDIPFHKRTLATARKISLDQLYSTARSHEKAQHTTHPPPANRGPLRKLMHLSIAPAQMGSPQEDVTAFNNGLLARRRGDRSDAADGQSNGVNTPLATADFSERPRTAMSSIHSPVSIASDQRSGSPASYRTDATSLPALQQKGLDENDLLEPLQEEDLDPGSFDLVAPVESTSKQYSLERRSELLFSKEHLKIIFEDPSLLLRFTAFLSYHRAGSIPILIYYLDAVKALKAISYSNAIAEALDPIEGFDFTKTSIQCTLNKELEEKSRLAFEAMVREDLPAYITHIYIQTVSLSIQRRITGTLPSHLREASEGLAEVFCLTDPSRPDNPIVFSSEEFHRTTQYGMTYVIGRNCRFLQGPKTNPFSVRRIREKIDAGKEHCEVFLNYRRDGSPFMNMLMIAPLTDSRGVIRYFVGAQVDVSGLVKECSDLDSLRRLAYGSENNPHSVAGTPTGEAIPGREKNEFQELSEMLNLQELDTVRKWGGRMHKFSDAEEDVDSRSANWNKPRLVINNLSPNGRDDDHLQRGRLSGIYENYLLVRPYPNLRILFASPSLRVPGILQSPLLNKIGGSQRVRDELTQALANGRGVTARVRWVSKTDLEGRSRWIHCTPLIGSNNTIGVWMVVLVDDEDQSKRFRQAPAVDPKFGRSIPFNHKTANSGSDFGEPGMQNDKQFNLRNGAGSRAQSVAESDYTVRID